MMTKEKYDFLLKQGNAIINFFLAKDSSWQRADRFAVELKDALVDSFEWHRWTLLVGFDRPNFKYEIQYTSDGKVAQVRHNQNDFSWEWERFTNDELKFFDIRGIPLAEGFDEIGQRVEDWIYDE